MDAVTKQCHIGLLAAGAVSAKGKRGAAAANIKAIGIGISKSNWPNSSSFQRFSSATGNNTHVLPLAPPEVKAHKETVVASKIQTESESESKTAHVKFVLQRACMFGEQFFLVGDDPMLGLWDPSSAIPLEWSDGHLWTAAMDIPVGRCVQFKFLLRGLSGEVRWQPGPDRVLRIWDTQNTIVVSEDWKDAGSQKVTEERPASKEPNVAAILTGDDSSKLPQILDREMRVSSIEVNPLLVSGLTPTYAMDCNSAQVNV